MNIVGNFHEADGIIMSKKTTPEILLAVKYYDSFMYVNLRQPSRQRTEKNQKAKNKNPKQQHKYETKTKEAKTKQTKAPRYLEVPQNKSKNCS